MNKKLVDAFLTWSLPETVVSDNCASVPGYPHRYGTNLLNQPEAQALIEYLLSELIGTIGDMTPVFTMLQSDKISQEKAREYLDAWVRGELDVALKSDGR